jgi:hypothetical protein
MSLWSRIVNVVPGMATSRYIEAALLREAHWLGMLAPPSLAILAVGAGGPRCPRCSTR